ncbi:MAG: NAD(P)/FAD-dependent oxidoreductase [Bacteroidota bacterium]|jgi:thioredoxin reductase (NADPH)
MITTDLIIIGAGPVGLFAVFEAGLLKMRCHLIDYLPQPGGQLSEIYPRKPIYDIPGFPTVLAQELIDNLLQQAAPFKPGFTLGERVETIQKIDECNFQVTTNLGTVVSGKAVVIAGGLGCFEPRKPEVKGLDAFENGKGIHYFVREPEYFRNRKVVIAGGGDSALDWTLQLASVCSSLTLVHRSDQFRGVPDSAERVKALAESGLINLLLHTSVENVNGLGRLSTVSVKNLNTQAIHDIEADELIILFGLSPKLGPASHWGLDIEKQAVVVNPEDYSTSVKGIYAIGDINTYKNKLKLILCGFHEAAMMSHSAYKYINPGVHYTMKYTTVNGVNTF